MTTAYIGLGSNEGDRLANLASALEAISAIPSTHLDRVSHVYESEPAYLADQERFANAVARLTTSLHSGQLLGYLGDIEVKLGRVRSKENGPRAIDLDILLFGSEELNTPDLTIPHPRMLEREFVVTPLLDVAPDVRMPDGACVSRDQAVLGKVVGDLGQIPGLGAFCNEPAMATDWVEIASYRAGSDVASACGATVSVQREALQEAGIPYAFDPYDPSDVMNPWGLPRTFRILVPADYAERAKRVVADVMQAEPQLSEEFEIPTTE
jgi:2-amino-4-hydroxy-6-hydroxymethyldihydropteridine diphosphokinase